MIACLRLQRSEPGLIRFATTHFMLAHVSSYLRDIAIPA